MLFPDLLPELGHLTPQLLHLGENGFEIRIWSAPATEQRPGSS